MSKPLADYVKLPQLEEYKEWFKDFADLYREDGILQVTWKTLDGPMQHSGMSHRAIGQLVRVLSLDFKNEIIIFTHIGDSWMTCGTTPTSLTAPTAAPRPAAPSR